MFVEEITPSIWSHLRTNKLFAVAKKNKVAGV